VTDNLPAVRRVTDIDGGPLPRGRVSKRLEKAIRLIEEGGYSISLAAEGSGYQYTSLMAALKKPHVRAYRAGVKRAWRESEAPKSWNRIVKLAENAGSEKVKLEANKTILTALGELTDESEAPGNAVALIQIIRNEVHNHGQPLSQRLPGVVQVEQFQDAEYQPLDPNPGLTPSDDA
jgi:hypothetical protein